MVTLITVTDSDSVDVPLEMFFTALHKSMKTRVGLTYSFHWAGLYLNRMRPIQHKSNPAPSCFQTGLHYIYLIIIIIII